MFKGPASGLPRETKRAAADEDLGCRASWRVPLCVGHSWLFFQSSGHLNGFKRSIHDGGTRTPFIARWKGVIRPNSRSSHHLSFADVMPTLAELAGPAAQSMVPGDIDGKL